nr:MAG TPA: RNA polymerase subunit [Caudoviricetes sp.]
MDRFCPDCGVLLEAGHARCRSCFLQFEARHQRLTERFWMERNYPEFRPRDLFPEDMEVSSTREEIIR